MAGKIALEIVTPEGIQFSGEVDEFTAPSVEGEFGVLPGHRPILAGLRTGIIRFTRAGEAETVAIGPGFAKVADDKANILTNHFIKKEDVDAIVARKEFKEAEEALSGLSSEASEAEKAGAIGRARWAAVRLELYGDPPPATVVIQHAFRLLGHEDYTQTLAQTAHDEVEGGATGY